MGAHGRPESSVSFAPDVEPLAMSHEYVHRSPVLVMATDGARVEVDLEGLSADSALGFIDRLRATLDLFGAQWKDWEARAALDRTGPYPMPPVVYGFPGDNRESGDAAVSGEVPEPAEGSPRSRRRRTGRIGRLRRGDGDGTGSSGSEGGA